MTKTTPVIMETVNATKVAPTTTHTTKTKAQKARKTTQTQRQTQSPATGKRRRGRPPTSTKRVMINDDLGQMRIGAMLPMGIPGMSTPLTNAMMASAAAAYASQLQAAFSASTSFYAPHAGAFRSSADVTVNVNGTCATDDNTSMRNHYFASPNGDPVSAAATFAHRMMMYQRTAYGTLGQYYASEARAIRDARGTYAQSHMNQTTNRNAAQLVAAGECARGRASIAGVDGGKGEPSASQKQWPIVPQVSTAICPPKSDLVRSTPPGAFGRPQAVNAGVQEASAAKTKAKKAAEENASGNEDSRSSRDDPEAAAAAAEAVVKRVNEAKALLDPSAELYRGEHAKLRSRGQRSSAPSPESSLGAPVADGQPEHSEALGSKGSKSAAA